MMKNKFPLSGNKQPADSKQSIVFTDVDHCLVGDDLSLGNNAVWVKRLQRAGGRVILVSSKPLAPLQALNRKLNNRDYIVFENGAGIFDPLAGNGKGRIVLLAKPYAVVKKQMRSVLTEMRIPQAAVVYVSMSWGRQKLALLKKYFPKWNHVQMRQNISPKKRCDVGFAFQGRLLDPRLQKKFIGRLRRKGVAVHQGGSLLHAVMGSDKGVAVKKVIKAIAVGRKQSILTVALGDSQNDRPMFGQVDQAFVAPLKGAYHISGWSSTKRRGTTIKKTSKPAPEAFAQVIQWVLRRPV